MDTPAPLARRLIERMKDRLVPWEVTLEITKYCNFDCVHCYVPRDKLGVRREMTLSEITSFLDDFHSLGGMFLHLTGGEVMVHRHFLEIVRHARALGMALKISSNGSRVDAGVADDLVRLGVGYVGVSLYGATPETAERVARKKGAFETAIQGIRLLAAQGIQVRLKIPVVRGNYHDVPERVAIARSMGLPFSIDYSVTPRNDGDRSTEAERIGLPQMQDLHRRIQGEYRQHMFPNGLGDRVRWLSPQPVAEPAKMGVSSCNVGMTFCAVDSFGDVFPCIAFPAAAGNLREQSFAEIWTTSPLFLKLREATLQDVKGCNTCDAKPRCSRCMGHAYLVDGDMMGPSSLDCIRAGKEVPSCSGAGKLGYAPRVQSGGISL